MLVGYRCPLDDSNKSFDFCFYKCPAKCTELPILISLSSSREVVKDVYSVTEILKPPRVVNYMRQVDYWSSPFDLIYMSLGSAFHTIVESNGMDCPMHSFESALAFRAKLDIGGREITLTGKPDQYNEAAEILTDYKTAGYYAVKKLMDGDWEDSTYKLQVNMYRRHRFPNCKRQQLVMLVKDYTRKLKIAGVRPIINIQVPWMTDEEIDIEEKIRLMDILVGDEDWRKSRDCTPEERWVNERTGEFVRCMDYCLVAPDCPQLLENGERLNGKKKT